MYKNTIKMNWHVANIFTFILITISISNAQPQVYKICVSSKFEDECSQMQRGNSEVLCQRVQDSIECAQRLDNGTADFGMFTAENVLHLATLDWRGVTVAKQLVHGSRDKEPVDYESVVIVRQNHSNGLLGLGGKKFCHPGLIHDKSHRWTERFLKYFERKIALPNCTISDSPAELEAYALSAFFGQSCRPGKWTHDLKEDIRLKKKYPSLCAFCGGDQCNYPSASTNGHHQALECLKRGGDVTYVALKEAKKFFNTESPNEYHFLCPNGTLQNIHNNSNPCVWLRQPWPVLLTKSESSVTMRQNIESWMTRPSSESWLSALRTIITNDKYIVIPATIQTPRDYVAVYREVPNDIDSVICGRKISWCTTSAEEKDKCEIVKAGALSSGVQPVIDCREQPAGIVSCLKDLSAGRSDFLGIDSNFGYLARSLYNLTSALFFETEIDQYSSVVAVIKASSKVERFEQLKGSKLCLPEFGGIASMAFINLGKNRGFFAKRECRYGKLLHNFFGDSCAPGAKDLEHDPQNKNPESLCGICKANFTAQTQRKASLLYNPKQNLGSTLTHDVDCAADTFNQYYGNRGALRCLNEAGDVAILELQSLKEHAQALNLSETDFRIICANGSLAQNTGFDVDLKCALTTIIDGEIIVHRNSKNIPGIVNALTALDAYLQVDPDFKMYNIYKGQRHLLFKDSTIGLIGANEDTVGPMVENYIKLFANLEACVQGGASSMRPLNMLWIFISTLVALKMYF